MGKTAVVSSHHWRALAAGRHIVGAHQVVLQDCLVCDFGGGLKTPGEKTEGFAG